MKMKTSHLPSFAVVNTCTHASSIHSSVSIVSAFNWIQWCTGWIKLSLQLNGMVPVGGTRGGSLGAGAEKSSALRASAARVRAQLLLGVKGDPGGLDWLEKTQQNLSCQIKTSQIWTLTDPFLKFLNTLHTFNARSGLYHVSQLGSQFSKKEFEFL